MKADNCGTPPRTLTADLLNRALEIERRSQKTNRTNRGLGGEGNKWADWLAMDEAQSKLMLDIEPHEIPCGCIDG